MTSSEQLATFLCFVVVLVSPVGAFYLPGVAPRDYAQGEKVIVLADNIDSVKTQLPFEYYKLDIFCPYESTEEESENLGEVLSGERIETTNYKVEMRINKPCQQLCVKTYDSKKLERLSELIEDEYRVNYICDNLPSAVKYYTVVHDGKEGDENQRFEEHYEKGFPLGFVGDGVRYPKAKVNEKYLNNHIRIILEYHPAGETKKDGYRVVGFEIEAHSVRHVKDPKDAKKLLTCNDQVKVDHESEPQPVSGVKGPADVIWTYDVSWELSNIRWASRWDLYLKMTNSEIHWFSIINSFMIVLFLSAMVALIMLRTLRRDFIRYNQLDDAESQQEETGWKLVWSEVFRAPQHGGIFSVLVGTGVQVQAMTMLTLVFAALGFLSPSSRGALMTALLFLFVLMGMPAGYFSTRTYNMFKLQSWKRNTFWTAIAFPGLCFGTFFVLNLFVWSKKSSGAVPFGTLVALLVLWFGISVPLVYVGSYFAFKRPMDPPPCSVNNIPRMIPEQPWYMSSYLSVFVSGVLPFGAVFIEIFFIMSSVWLHQFYYMFGFLFLVYLILIITCTEISIVMCYFQLCAEDYHWWWRSFFTSGSSAVYLLLYSFIYYSTKLDIDDFVGSILYFGYMSLACVAFFLLTGTTGFLACYWFVVKIYGSIKVD